MYQSLLARPIEGDGIIHGALHFLDLYATPHDPEVFRDPLFLQAMLEYVFESIPSGGSDMVTARMVNRATAVMAVPSLAKLPELAASPQFVGELLFFAVTGQAFAEQDDDDLGAFGSVSEKQSLRRGAGQDCSASHKIPY